MDLKIAVAVLVTLTVGLMAVLWLLGKPTHRFAAEIAAAPRPGPLVPWLASLAGQGLGGQTGPDAKPAACYAMGHGQAPPTLQRPLALISYYGGGQGV